MITLVDYKWYICMYSIGSLKTSSSSLKICKAAAPWINSNYLATWLRFNIILTVEDALYINTMEKLC